MNLTAFDKKILVEALELVIKKYRDDLANPTMSIEELDLTTVRLQQAEYLVMEMR